MADMQKLIMCVEAIATFTSPIWSEAGTFDDMEQAVALVKAWLLDWKEVDDLPVRSVRRYGI